MNRNENDSYNAFCFDLTRDFKRFCDAFTLFGEVQNLEERYEDHLSKWKRQKQEIMNSRNCTTSSNKVPFVNLSSTLQESSRGTDELPSKKRRKLQDDAWMSNATRIYSSIQQMYQLLNTNATVYCDPHLAINPMSDEEITILESSVTSFLTTSTGQIDSLRQAIKETMHEDMKNHRLGIVSHLLSELKVLMNHFQMLQKRRNREELELFRDPFKCSPYHDREDVLMEEEENVSSGGVYTQQCLDGLDDDYLARLEEEVEQFQQFYKEYEDDDVLEEIASIPLHLPCEKHISTKHDDTSDTKPSVRFDPKFAPKTPEFQQQQQHAFDFAEKNRETEILEQEQSLLSASVQNTKLDGVQKAESQMMQVTALLSQFANLISEQQEEVQMIADSTKESRKNVDSGREKLVHATEQKKKRRHYFAWVIFIMGLLLLFLNTIID